MNIPPPRTSYRNPAALRSRPLLAGIWALVFLLFSATSGWAQFLPNVPDAGKPLLAKQTEKAAIIKLTGEVDDVMRASLERRVDVARKAGCTLIIYEMDTYGGQVTSALEISKFTKDLDLPVAVWIHDKAISAGSLISLASPTIVTSPSTTLGDCMPIQLSAAGMEAIPDDIKAKVRSPLLQEFRNSADKNHYNPVLLEAMVVPEIEIFEMWKPDDPNAGYRYVDRAGHDALLKERKPNPNGGAPIPVWRNTKDGDLPVDSDKSLLTVGSAEAVKMGLSKREVANEDQLRASLNIVGKDLITLDYTWSELLVRWLADTWVRFALFFIMLVMAYIEFSHPGAMVPGALALLCLVLLVGAPLITGLAQWWEVAVILIGVGIVAADLFVYGGVGLLAIPGFVLIAVGIVFSFVPTEPGRGLPTMPGTYTALQTGLSVVLFGTLCSIVAMAMLAKYLHMTPGLRRIQLAPSGARAPSAAVLDANLTPAHDFIFPGALGVADSDLRPAGKARFDRHLANVITQGDFIPAGTPVTVLEASARRIVVKRQA